MGVGHTQKGFRFSDFSPPPSVHYQDEPDKPAKYVAQSSTPMSLRAHVVPLRPVMARNPPPEPMMAMVGTWGKISR